MQKAYQKVSGVIYLHVPVIRRPANPKGLTDFIN
jgi:hypothetical protein